MAFSLIQNPWLLTWALNGVYTANGAVYTDLHTADRQVHEAAMYHLTTQMTTTSFIDSHFLWPAIW